MSSQQVIAPPMERVAAGFFDLLASSVVSFVLFYLLMPLSLHWLAGIASFLYLILRDSLPFLNYQSIGKKIVGLRVVKTSDGSPLSFVESVKRNFVFLPNLFNTFGLMVTYVTGTLIFLLLIFEVYKLFNSADCRRLGDELADTIVIKERA